MDVTFHVEVGIASLLVVITGILWWHKQVGSKWICQLLKVIYNY